MERKGASAYDEDNAVCPSLILSIGVELFAGCASSGIGTQMKCLRPTGDRWAASDLPKEREGAR